MRKLGSLLVSLALLTTPALGFAADSGKEAKASKPAATKHSHRHHAHTGSPRKPASPEQKTAQ